MLFRSGYEFSWSAEGGATLTDRIGNRIKCPVKGYVPMLIDEGAGRPTAAAPTRLIRTEERLHIPEPEVELEEDFVVIGLPDANTPNQDKLLAEAQSIQHMMTHRPKNPMCEVCLRAKAFKAQARRKGPAHRAKIETFGEVICADHFIVRRDDEEGVDGEKCALMILDIGTRITDVAPVKDKSANEAVLALKNFAGNHGVKSLYTDNSQELKAAGRTLVWPHATSTPYQPQTNSLVERQIGIIVQGARAALLQGGFPHKMWPFASKRHAMATNFTVSPSATEIGRAHV